MSENNHTTDLTNQNPTEIESNPKAKNNTINFIEPATIVTLLIGAIYYIGWVYIDSYFRRLGINHLSLELSTSYYLLKGYLSLASLLIFFNILYFFIDMSKDSEDSLILAIVDNTILCFIISIIFYPFDATARAGHLISWLAIIMTVTIAIFFTVENKSLLKFLFPSSNFKKFAVPFITVIILSLTAYIAGENRAKATIEGKNLDVNGISIVWKDDILEEIADKQVILIIHNKENYYVVEKAETAPDMPKVYIIPDEMVKYAVTTPVSMF